MMEPIACAAPLLGCRHPCLDHSSCPAPAPLLNLCPRAPWVQDVGIQPLVPAACPLEEAQLRSAPHTGSQSSTSTSMNAGQLSLLYAFHQPGGSRPGPGRAPCSGNIPE